MLEGVAGYRLTKRERVGERLIRRDDGVLIWGGQAGVPAWLGKPPSCRSSTPQSPKTHLLSLHCCGCAWIAVWLLAWVYSSLISLLNCINWRRSSRFGTPPLKPAVLVPVLRVPDVAPTWSEDGFWTTM